MEEILAASQEIALHIRGSHASPHGILAEAVIGAAAAIAGARGEPRAERSFDRFPKPSS